MDEIITKTFIYSNKHDHDYLVIKKGIIPHYEENTNGFREVIRKSKASPFKISFWNGRSSKLAL